MAKIEFRTDNALITMPERLICLQKKDENLSKYDCLIFMGVFSFYEYSGSVLPGHDIYIFEAREEFLSCLETIKKGSVTGRLTVIKDDMKNQAAAVAAHIRYLPKNKIRMIRNENIYALDPQQYRMALSGLNERKDETRNNTESITEELLTSMIGAERGAERDALALIKFTVFGAS